MKNLWVFGLIIFSVAACDSQQQAVDTAAEKPAAVKAAPVVAKVAETQDFATLIQQAEDLYTQTEGVKHAWTINLDRLKDARLAAEAGDMDKAVANAEEAIKLSRLALKQAESEKTQWRARVPQ
ncbi:MAG: hypothetical protein L3J22_02335 [Xanthomonadales bacterium]|nr:hypothetical protein [Xanthomonadales bacterium]